jgi:hypothetical protein
MIRLKIKTGVIMMFEKYLIQCENGNFVRLLYSDYENKVVEVEEWADISEADLFSKEVAEEHLNHIINGGGFWRYVLDEDIKADEFKIKRVTITIE